MLSKDVDEICPQLHSILPLGVEIHFVLLSWNTGNAQFFVSGLFSNILPT